MEVSRKPDVINSGLQSVAAAIAKASEPQAAESLDQAIQSFAWASVHEKPTDVPDWAAFVGQATIPEAGHSESPAAYLANAQNSVRDQTKFQSILPMDQVMSALRNPTLSYQKGVAEFLKTGIQEALASLKINVPARMQQPLMPPPLDELLTQEKLKNPNPAALQPSLKVMNEMFATLKRMQSSSLDVEANR